ncbi:DUF4954 family protein [Flaviaesturariibacter amylovorans]|uniref:DUF4954 family protein n=1 Tax=Flaviaesturariibacter amylovorans TaxID=1084520 RepID=A0ABP8GIR9_9BACT
MNEIRKLAVSAIGYGFIDPAFLPEGKDEYHLRNLQNRSGISYRNLSAYEIEVLVRNNNTSDDWNKIQVSDLFNPELVKNCKFFGLVRIGKLESLALQHHNVTHPVGLYNSTIISCDFGDNVVVDNVKYLANYIIGNEVLLLNIHELHTTQKAKFGNGILKEGEDEAVRVWLEVCNENAGRKIIPFNGMLPGDAWLWAHYRADKALMDRFKELTQLRFDAQRGYYGKIGDRCVIKNTSIIKDVWLGSDAYIKGANKLKNLTINSAPDAMSQVGEGCELVNGIVGYGCRVFYGVKAVRFVMASHSQLKYGARLINSYLGNNATISCCEVLNSLIFPAHEQHHNNSFLCAALIMGQSNMAAGATIGSNHNSRAADGEIVAGRGFWPGLCVSLKHNSKFACFTLIAKGAYSSELNITLPFSLVSNDEGNNRLVVMPAYWFQYNMYALARNAYKYVDRDKRTRKRQYIEYDFLAPDSMNEVMTAIRTLERFTALHQRNGDAGGLSDAELEQEGRVALQGDTSGLKAGIRAYGFENAGRMTLLTKVPEAYRIYRELVVYYAVMQLLSLQQEQGLTSFDALKAALPAMPARGHWHNVGGQLMSDDTVQGLIAGIKNGTLESWKAVHALYEAEGARYAEQKRAHALACLLEQLEIGMDGFNETVFNSLLPQVLRTKEWMVAGIFRARAKDYENPFRKMVYETDAEMNEVIGHLDENSFIAQQREELETLRNTLARLWK